MFDPPQPPPPPTVPPAKPSIFTAKMKVGIALTIGIIAIGLLGDAKKPETTKPSIPLTPVTLSNGSALTETQAWLLGNQKAITRYLDEASVYSARLASDTTPSAMMRDCAEMLTMVDGYYYSSWKTDAGAPTSWIRLLNLMHDGLTYCAAGDFTRGGEAVKQAADQQDAFTADIKAATP